jgi:hypothetical protein
MIGTRAFAISLAVVLALCPATPLAAQQIRGQVVLSDSSSRAAGVIVVATDARGEITRTLSGLNGDFLLRLPHAGRFNVEALRIGYRPTALPPVMVADGETSSVRIVLDDTPVTLAAVTVRGNNVCHISLDSGQAVAKIWQEARTAIAATQLSASEEPLVARWIVFDSLGDRTAKSMRSGRMTLYEGATTSVFESVSADSLERFGYVVENLGQLSFYAPDANVLLSDSFAGDHCFHSEPPPPEHADWIGVAFQPTNDRPGHTDVEGTLWLDRVSAELRLLEFRYTRLPAGLGIVQPRGMVEFLRLSSGNWIINRWTIRIPRVQKIAATKKVAALYAPTAIQLKGGAVTEVRHVGIVLFRAKPPAGRILGVFDDATGQPIVGADVIDTDAETKATTSVSGAVQLAFLGVDSTVVQVRKIGYLPKTISVATSAADTVPFTVVLTPIAQTLPTVVTTGKVQATGAFADFERRRLIGLGHFMTEEEIEKRPSFDLIGYLQRMPGLMYNIAYGQSSAHSEGVVERFLMRGGSGLGSGFCTPNFFLDGMYYPLDEGARPLQSLALFAQPQYLKGIEVYENGAMIPAQFDRSPSTGCGSVVIWTK